MFYVLEVAEELLHQVAREDREGVVHVVFPKAGRGMKSSQSSLFQSPPSLGWQSLLKQRGWGPSPVCDLDSQVHWDTCKQGHNIKGYHHLIFSQGLLGDELSEVPGVAHMLPGSSNHWSE